MQTYTFRCLTDWNTLLSCLTKLRKHHSTASPILNTIYPYASQGETTILTPHQMKKTSFYCLNLIEYYLSKCITKWNKYSHASPNGNLFYYHTKWKRFYYHTKWKSIYSYASPNDELYIPMPHQMRPWSDHEWRGPSHVLEGTVQCQPIVPTLPYSGHSTTP